MALRRASDLDGVPERPARARREPGAQAPARSRTAPASSVPEEEQSPARPTRERSTRQGERPRRERPDPVAKQAARRAKIADLPADEQLEHAKTYILNVLTMVAKTRGELHAKCTERGYPDEIIVAALDRLTEVGVIDDAAYARDYAASRQRSRGLSASAIRRELARKRLDPALIDAAVEGIDRDDEYATAVDLVRRKAPGTARLDRQARVRRLTGMLIRKGYSPSVAFTVVKEVLADVDLDDVTVD